MNKVFNIFGLLVFLGLCSCGNNTDNSKFQNGFESANSYNARLTFLKNNAQPVFDVAIVGLDSTQNRTLLDSLVVSGYAYKFIDANSLNTATATKQTIKIDGFVHRLLVLQTEHVSNDIRKLSDDGSVVCHLDPNYDRTISGDKILRKIKFGKGGVVSNQMPHHVLKSMQVDPQFTFPGDHSIAWQQMHYKGIDIFTVENSSSIKQTFEAGFGTLAGAPELWNPYTGEMFAVDNYIQVKGTIHFEITLEPNTSMVYVFGTNTDRDNMETYSL